jgi:hypothetical protein
LAKIAGVSKVNGKVYVKIQHEPEPRPNRVTGSNNEDVRARRLAYNTIKDELQTNKRLKLIHVGSEGDLATWTHE